jgi:hypothetical protein
VTVFNQVKNRTFTTLVDGIDNSTDPVTFTVTDGSIFPNTANGHFNVTIDNEILHVTDVTGNEVTCARSGADVEGTSKGTHAVGATIALNVTAKVITDLNTAVNACEAYSVLTEKGSIVQRDTSAPVELTHGSAGNYLKSGGSAALNSWDAPETAPTDSAVKIPASQYVYGMSRRNAIINGCGIVNQRVTAYTLAKDVYNWDVTNLTGPDRFEGMATGTAVTAGTYNNITTASCGVSGYAFRFTNVTLTGAGEIHHRYRMEAKDAVQFKNQTVSFRCQVYQNTGGAINYRIYVRKANAADNFAAVTAISDSGAISVPNTTATSLPYLAIAMGDCSNGIEIEVVASAGAITTKNFEFTEWQLELGSVATPFEYRPFAQEFGLCMRYCRNFTDVTAPFRIYSYGNAGWEVYSPIFLGVPMRITPTATVVGTWQMDNCSAFSMTILYPMVVHVKVTVTATGAWAIYPNSADDAFTVEAEL